jgi:hypothetical protein
VTFLGPATFLGEGDAAGVAARDAPEGAARGDGLAGARGVGEALASGVAETAAASMVGGVPVLEADDFPEAVAQADVSSATSRNEPRQRAERFTPPQAPRTDTSSILRTYPEDAGHPRTPVAGFGVASARRTSGARLGALCSDDADVEDRRLLCLEEAEPQDQKCLRATCPADVSQISDLILPPAERLE